MMRIFLILFLFVFPMTAAAQTATMPSIVAGDFKDLKHTSSARIDKVIDGQTVLMKDGKVIRLSALFYPYEEGGKQAASMVTAKKKLERVLPENTEVMIYQTRDAKRGRTNRMGHELAHLVIKKTGEWVNGAIIAYGYAYVLTDADNPQMVTQLYALEEKARSAHRGLWQEGSRHGVLNADNAAEGDGAFRVIEGVITRAATNSNNLYLNFGDDWRKDFSVKISSAQRRQLSKQGIDPMAIAGHKIRVRGWVREWNGPYVELEHVNHLELLAAPLASPLPATPTETETLDSPPETTKTRQVNP